MNCKVARRGQRVEERARAQAFAEARAEVLEEARAEALKLRAECQEIGRRLLRRMLEHRFAPPPLPVWVHERLALATTEDFYRWNERLTEEAVTLEQIFLN